MILLFGVWLDWLPVAGWGGLRGAGPSRRLPGASLRRLGRAADADEPPRGPRPGLRPDGPGEGALRGARRLWPRGEGGDPPRHLLRGAARRHLLTGSLVIEQIFAIPGIGPFFVNSVLNRDLFMVGGVILVYSVLLIAFNIVVDVLYALLDRRIRLQ